MMFLHHHQLDTAINDSYRNVQKRPRNTDEKMQKAPQNRILQGLVSILSTTFSPSNRNDFPIRLETELRCASADFVGDVARRQMAIMLLDHARGAVAKVLRHDQQRHA